MKTAVLVDSGPARNASRSDAGGYAGSSRQTIPLVLEPARKQARKPKRVVVPFSDSRPRLERSDARIQVPKLVVWAWLELGFVMVLFASAFYLILLSAVAAGNL